MKKVLSVIAFVGFGAATLLAQDVYYRDRTLYFDRSERPYMVRNVLMVPARTTAEMIGADFDRDDREGLNIRMVWQNNRLRYHQGDHAYQLNGKSVELGTTSDAVRGILYVPARMFRDLTDGAFSVDKPRVWRDDPDHGRPIGGRDIYFDRRVIYFERSNWPFLRNNVLMVPFRDMAERIDATTGRSDDGQRVWINFDRDRAEYDKGRNWYRLNGVERKLPTSSEDRGGVLYVPITIFEGVTHGRVRS